MDCYDTTACPGDCEVCPLYEKALAYGARRRRGMARAAVLCFAACAGLLFLAMIVGGAR